MKPPGSRDDSIVLCYHAVSSAWPADLSISPERLRAHLTYLIGRGYRGVTFSEIVAGGTGKRLAVTFDDAYRSVADLAQPILASLRVPGTLFVPTDWVGVERPMAWPGIEQWLGGEHERELIPMDWDEVRDLRDGGWEIGSHTCSHPKLSKVDPDIRRTELIRSKAICEAELGSCSTIAYPYGDHDDAVDEAAADAGYLAACTLPAGYPPPKRLAWPRIGIYNHDDMRSFRLKVSPIVRRARGSAVWPVVADRLRPLRRKALD